VKSSHVAAAMIFTLMICRPAASQNVPALADLESAAISDAKAPDLAFPEPFQQPIPQPPPPAEPELIQADTSWREYRTTIESFEERRHRFVHCKLKNGKVLTGLIRGIGRDGFSLHTNALGGPRILYKDLAEPPRPVPAVGTRLKQGAQWTGIGAVIVVVVPVLIVLSPLLFFSGAWQC